MDLEIMAFKGILNTIIRILPLSLHMGTLMSNLMYDNKNAKYLLLGFVLVELISGGYLMIFKNVNINPNCGLIKSRNSSFNLPSPAPTTIGFFVGFMISEMFLKEDFKPIKFYCLILLLLVTIWSRINVGCHTLIESCVSGLIGLFMGIGFLNIIKGPYLQTSNNTINDTFNEENKIYQLLNLN